MPGERTLLDRLRHPPGPQRTVHQDAEALQQSVLTNLRRIFNSRQDQVATVADFGMPDLTDLPHSMPDSVETVRRAIQQGVAKYEPRLHGVRVRHIADEDDPRILRFEITARLVIDDGQSMVRYESVVNPAGRVRVRG